MAALSSLSDAELDAKRGGAPLLLGMPGVQPVFLAKKCVAGGLLAGHIACSCGARWVMGGGGCYSAHAPSKRVLQATATLTAMAVKHLVWCCYAQACNCAHACAFNKL